MTRNARAGLSLIIVAVLLLGCNIWTLLVDPVPTGNIPGRVLSTSTMDPTPSREAPPVESPDGTRTDTSAYGFGPAAGNADATPTIPPPPPIPGRSTEEAIPCIAPPGANCALP